MYMEPKTLFCAYASLVFIVCCLVCAAVRWFHMCRPFDREKDFYYPARKQVALSYLVIGLLQIPYFLHPSDPGAATYTLLLGIIYYPVCFTVVLKVYFNLRSFNNKIYTGVYCLTALLLLFLFILELSGADSLLERNAALFSGLGAAFSLCLTLIFLSIILHLKRIIDNYHHQNWSDEEDFPLAFAEKVFWLPLIWIALMWIIFLTGSLSVKAVSDLVLSVFMVAFLCLILHPQRMKGEKSNADILEDSREELEQPTGTKQTEAIDREAKDQVLGIIQRRFREPHLQKSEVLSEVSKGKIAAANRYITSVGYYNLINSFRLEYARRYSEANPMIKLSIVALEAGFASGSSYSKAKKSIRDIDPEIASRIQLN